jgi:hypothetical protein
MTRPLRAGHLSLSAQDRWWYARAAEEIRATPVRWLRLLWVKTALFLNAAESSNNKALGYFTAVSFPVRHYRWWYGVLVCLALPGLVARPARTAACFACIVAGFGASVALFFVSERYRLPIYILENGLSLHDTVSPDGQVHDPRRIDFMTGYLLALRRAIGEGADVKGYLHWTLLDNFEWHAGFRERFGLVHVDFDTQKRTPKDSARWYAAVIASNGGRLDARTTVTHD